MSNSPSQSVQLAATEASEKAASPAGTRFEWSFALLSALLVGGIFLVGSDTRRQEGGVPGLLSPGYILLAVGFVSLTSALLLRGWRSHQQGTPWKRSLPQGYAWSLPGALLFAGGLAATQVWQAVSGGLTPLETLLLPSTLAALLGTLLLVSRPLAAAWRRLPSAGAPGWATIGPALLALVWVLSLCAFLTQFAHPWVQPFAAASPGASTVLQDLYIMQADGSAQRRLTFSPESGHFAPSWSPDGQQIAFAHNGVSIESPSNLFVMQADGTRLRQLTFLSLNCYLQQWSPDGKQLVFVAQEGDNVQTAAIYTVQADGSHLRRLTHEDSREYGPVWSPDGQRIAFGSLQGGTWHLAVMDADGSHLHRLPIGRNANKPTWSPDGRFLVFTSLEAGHDNLYVMAAEGGSARLLTRDGDHAAWSPDGQQIVFMSYRTSNTEIYLIRPDGSGLTNLSRNPGVDNWFPAWSPDSQQIVYMTQRVVAPPDQTALGIASLLLQTALLLGGLVLLLRRWRAPFGAVTVLLFVYSLLLSLLGGQYAVIPVGLVTGLIADLLLWWLPWSRAQPARSWLFAGSVPVVWATSYYLILFLTQGIAWSLPLVTGSIILASLVGLGVGLVVGTSGFSSSPATGQTPL